MPNPLSPVELRAVFPTLLSSIAVDSTGFRFNTLRGDASSRRYHRIFLDDPAPGRSWIVMELAESAHRSDEITAHTAPDELPFINVHRFLARRGVPVPKILHDDREHGMLLLEDLGDVTFESWFQDSPPPLQAQRYETAIDALLHMQQATLEKSSDCIAFERAFEVDLLRSELEHFREYGLAARGILLSPSEDATLAAQHDALAAELASLPRRFVHRDFQSRNLMLTNGQIRIIDFQDALLGTEAYDLVALLRDSYIELAPDLFHSLLHYYVRHTGADPLAFRRTFDLQTVQRKLKDAGRFVFIDRVKGNPSFLPHIPSSLRYAHQALDRLPEYRPLLDVLRRHIPEFSP